MQNRYVIPVAPGYEASYDTGRANLIWYPVVAVGVNGDEGVALVLSSSGALVRVDDEGLPGDFTSVAPAAWPEAK